MKTIEFENLKNSDNLICLILSKIYPILFTASILQEENEIETLTKTFMTKHKTSEASLEYLRLMQVVIMAKSVYYNEEEEENEGEEDIDVYVNSDKLGISFIEKSGAKAGKSFTIERGRK